MSDKVINSVTKIPLLGDIPILGFFFRSTTKHIVKTNLIIALTPYVINDQSDLRRVLEKKMKERREFVERFGGEERAQPRGADRLPPQARHAGGDQPRRARDRGGRGADGRHSRSRMRWTSRRAGRPLPARAGVTAAPVAAAPAPRCPARRGRAAAGRRPGAGRPRPAPPPVALGAVRSASEADRRAAARAQAAERPSGQPSRAAVIEQALRHAAATEGGRIGEILVKMRAVTEEEVLQALGKQLGIAYSAELEGRRRRRRAGRRRCRSASPSSTACCAVQARGRRR